MVSELEQYSTASAGPSCLLMRSGLRASRPPASNALSVAAGKQALYWGCHAQPIIDGTTLMQACFLFWCSQIPECFF